MSHPARGPAQAGIAGQANAIGGRQRRGPHHDGRTEARGMSHPARGPARAGIAGQANAIGGRQRCDEPMETRGARCATRKPT
jgi:hypothetical protein